MSDDISDKRLQMRARLAGLLYLSVAAAYVLSQIATSGTCIASTSRPQRGPSWPPAWSIVSAS
ncbi:MAG TPA: hypothetical protein VGI95_02635 [Caulobacteraceae bacterium]